MKPKNQQPLTSENDAKEKLIIYVFEYLCQSGARNAAHSFLKEINYEREIQINENHSNGFLAGWWFVFWDLYCAAADKKPGQPEPSAEARVFHDYNRGAPGMSPSCAPNTSPPEVGGPPPGFMPGGGGPPNMMAAPRYAGPHSNHPMRPNHMNVQSSRMQNMIPQGGPPPPMGQMVNPPPSQPPHQVPPMMASPRYAPHSGHMTPGSSASIGPEPGPSPGINRMTPNHSGSPHPQQVGPPNNMPPMAGSVGGPHGGPPPQVQQMSGPAGPMQGMQPRNGQPPPQNWQGNFGSPAEQQFMPPPVSSSHQSEFGGMLMSDGGMMDIKGTNNNGPPQNQPQDDYGMTVYGQQGDQGDEVMKLKETLENNDTDQQPGIFEQWNQGGHNVQ